MKKPAPAGAGFNRYVVNVPSTATAHLMTSGTEIMTFWVRTSHRAATLCRLIQVLIGDWGHVELQ